MRFLGELLSILLAAKSMRSGSDFDTALIRSTIFLTHTSSISIETERRPNLIAAKAVLPDPAKQSRTTSSGRVVASLACSSSDPGFQAGCLPF